MLFGVKTLINQVLKHQLRLKKAIISQLKATLAILSNCLKLFLKINKLIRTKQLLFIGNFYSHESVLILCHRFYFGRNFQHNFKTLINKL